MASTGGPRAAGSGRADEGKFRQRVDTHYKVMASAKNHIRLSGKVGLASSMGFVAMSGAALAQEHMAVAAISFFYAVLGAVTHRAWSSAAGSGNAEKNAASYQSMLRVNGLSLLTAFSAIVLFDGPPMNILLGFGGVWVIGMVACAMAYRATSSLLDAFKQQKDKAASKAS